MHGRSVWDDSKIAKLRELRSSGKTSKEIAQILGISYNAVCKAVSRFIVRNAVKNISQVALVDLNKVYEFYSVEEAIMRGIDNIPEGKLILETEFIKVICRKDFCKFHRFVSSNEEKFGKYRIKLKLDFGDSKWYWGKENTVLEAKRIRDL